MGMKFYYYTLGNLKKYFEKYYEILEIKEYNEMSERDSIYVIARKK